MVANEDSLEVVEEVIAAGAEGPSACTPESVVASALFESEPPWSLPPGVRTTEWDAFATYPNYLAAEIVAGLLENEGLPAIVEAWASFPGVGSATIWVPKGLIHRARWIVALGPPTDAELLFLATGKLAQPEKS